MFVLGIHDSTNLYLYSCDPSMCRAREVGRATPRLLLYRVVYGQNKIVGNLKLEGCRLDPLETLCMCCLLPAEKGTPGDVVFATRGTYTYRFPAKTAASAMLIVLCFSEAQQQPAANTELTERKPPLSSFIRLERRGCIEIRILSHDPRY